MHKKSNVVVGAVVLVVIGLVVAGFSLFGGQGKGEATNQLASASEIKEVEEVKTVQSSVGGSEGGSFVASKQGKKYFPVDCGTAKAIKEENKVYFGSEGEAQAAGYERSLTCK